MGSHSTKNRCFVTGLPLSAWLFAAASIAVVSIAAAPAAAQTTPVATAIDTAAAQVLAQTGVPSASVAVVQAGKPGYAQAYGNARLASDLAPALPATAAMRYSVGSVSKQFTAAAILLLQEDGKLTLDDPVGKYIPGLTQGDQVTIRQVLSHTSGYQDYWPEDYVMTPMLKAETAQQILDTWAKKPLDFDPGTKWQYSNTNYVIAGAIVEKVSGQKLMDLLEARIFHPLGMTSVYNSDEARLTTADATGYYRHGLGPLRPAPKEGRGWMFAAGELAMTAHDLSLWDASMLSRSILKPASYDQMFTEIKLKDGSGTHYGLGVDVLTYSTSGKPHRMIAHTGEVSGFVSDNTIFPDDGAAIAVLTNQDAVDAASILARQIFPALLGAATAATEPNPAEKQAVAIFRSLQAGKIDRTLLAPNLSDYFTAEALSDFATSLAPLGEPTRFKQAAEELRGGMTFHVFTVEFPAKKLIVTTYTYPDGKLEQYLVAPSN